MSEDTVKKFGDIIIVSPHPDDEVIGCYEILENSNSKISIVYSDTVEPKRREEALSLKIMYENVKVQLFMQSIPSSLFNKETTFYTAAKNKISSQTKQRRSDCTLVPS